MEQPCCLLSRLSEHALAQMDTSTNQVTPIVGNATCNTPTQGGFAISACALVGTSGLAVSSDGSKLYFPVTGGVWVVDSGTPGVPVSRSV